jgi:hypothetical protein
MRTCRAWTRPNASAEGNVDWASAGAGASVRGNVSRLRTSSILASRRPRSLGFGGVVLRSCFRNKVGRSAMDEQICEAQSCGDQRFFSAMPWNPLDCGRTVHCP